MQSINSQIMSITNELKLKKVEILIFNSKILFYRGEFNDFQNLVAKEGFDISFEEDNSDGLSFDFEGYQLIWVAQNAPKHVVIHECLHAVLNICTSRGIDRNDDEVLCYMLEYLVKNLL